MKVQKLNYSKTLIIAMALLIPFFGLTNLQAADNATLMMEGTIIAYKSESGKLAIQANGGELVVLAVTPDFDNKAFQKGDRVIVQYNQEKQLQSIKKQK